MKRAPEDPGGREIPNRDTAVARVFEERSDGIRRERILPRQDTAAVPPEPEPEPEAEQLSAAPVPPPVAEPAPATAAPSSTPTATAATPPATSPAPTVPVERLAASEPEAPVSPGTAPLVSRQSITVTAVPPAPPTPPRQLAPPPAAAAPQPVRPPQAAAPVPAPQPPPAQTAARTPPATPPARSAPVAGPTYRVQLGAFRSDAAANQAWVALQARLGAPLGGLRPTVLEASTSAGTFYRLQAGPLASRDSAVQTCSAIKAGGNDCFIVGPLP